MAEDKKDDKRKEKYTPYWEKNNETEHRLSDDAPDVHVYISKQRIEGGNPDTNVLTTEQNSKQQKTTE